MNKIMTIAKKELNTFLDSLSGYIILVVFLGITGFFTWLSANNIIFIGQADLLPFFSVAFWTLFFFVPALTMRSFAEEQNTGTMEILLTHPVSFSQVVIGKFLGDFLLILIALGFTLVYYISVALIGPIDHGATVSGYLGLIFVSMAYISIGIYASSLTRNQIIAFLIAVAIGIFFQFIFGIMASISSGILSEIFDFLGFNYHYQNFARGVVELKSVLYLITITVLALSLSVLNLYSRRYK